MKRAVDVLVSLLLILFASPVLAIAALTIWITSPGPILFRQRRMGRGFQSFEILKLRTMAHAEAGLAYTLGPDPRITRFGGFLRRSKIDELPQLWNVLCGQMSLVGPRPVLPELTEEFYEQYRFLLRARPGLTDPASLKYCQEASLLARASEPMQYFKTVVTPDKLQISSEYLKRANIWTDCMTMGMTAVICCFPSASRLYGELPPVPVSPAKRIIDRTTLAGEALLAQELAVIEDHVEEAAGLEGLPWIPLSELQFTSRAASSNGLIGQGRTIAG